MLVPGIRARLELEKLLPQILVPVAQILIPVPQGVWYGGGSGQLGKFPGQSTHLNAHAVNFVQEGDDQTVEVPQIEYKDPESHKPTLNEHTTTQNPCFCLIHASAMILE